MQVIKYPDKKRWSSLLNRPVIDYSMLGDTVKGVINDIKENGDEAVRKYTAKFDGVDITDFIVSGKEIKEAEGSLDEGLKSAIRHAKKNIETFHKSQVAEEKVIETEEGVRCWQKSVPIEKVGLYVPGGTAPLFSTVLMLAVPAKIAGCREIILCTPPDKKGDVHPAVLYAAQLSGVGKIFKIGGIQAIAAMAYGTLQVPKVYKIFGPGNQYVTAAKQLLSLSEVAIDMPAGPSEVAVMADESADPGFVASDLLSQAEHGIDSQVILVSVSEKFVEKVNKALLKQLEELPRKELAKQSLENSKAIVVANEDEMVDIINEYAPEHLIISLKNYHTVAEKIINAGSVFLGNFTPESAGDYTSGTNHTLPTNGFAKVYNGVNMDSFFKKITFQELNEAGLENIGPDTEKMALAEDLSAHANAVRIRLNSLKR